MNHPLETAASNLPENGQNPTAFGFVPDLSIVVPCYNEAPSVEQLHAGLARLRDSLDSKLAVEFVLVDDGSSDATWSRLGQYFCDWPHVQLVRHETNQGIAAALTTGVRHARAELVASLDADCTYDPLQLLGMLPLMSPDVDMVVASPYHPEGSAVGIPPWRLQLSRCASRMYRFMLRNKLHTYTSCVRLSRRSSVLDLTPQNGGFVGVVELLCRLDRSGGRIVEYPAILTVRKTGQSKMRLARTVFAHLKLLSAIAWQSFAGAPAQPLCRASVQRS